MLIKQMWRFRRINNVKVTFGGFTSNNHYWIYIFFFYFDNPLCVIFSNPIICGVLLFIITYKFKSFTTTGFELNREFADFYSYRSL